MLRETTEQVCEVQDLVPLCPEKGETAMNPRTETVIRTDVDIVQRKIKDKLWLFKRWKDNHEAIELIKQIINQ